ncbi:MULTISPECIES: surface carbohydrate biosynthesis protein [unclassified Marinobacter]|uniref:surface carbohydrate biosynthesis protein n=2 Tax=unclassified Marinobacter TaxID=83889 RepID=UPI000977A3F6|nr:surface carbohydrate biosynthesis protein [Marinobacter sp. LQ44]
MIPIKFFRSKKVVLSSVDSPRRDLGWRLLMAKKLADEGISTVLGKPHDIYLVLSLMRGALIFGRFGGNTGRGRFDLDLIKKIQKTASSMYFLHDEGAFYYKNEYESAVKRIYPEEYFSRPFLKKVYFWGDRQRTVFDRTYEDCDLSVTGAPRLDYLRFLEAQRKSRMENNNGCEPGSKYVLVCSRFAGISPAKDDISLISENFLNIRLQAEGASGVSEGELFGEQVKRWCAVSIERAQFIDAVYRLASSNPDTQFLFRPHPGEDASLYRSIYRFLDNVIVDKSGDLSRALEQANLFIHSESTSGVEAAVIGVPSINFSPRDTGDHAIAGASEVGEKVRDFAELEIAFKRLLAQPRASLRKDAELLFPYVKNSRSEFNAIDKICEDLNEHFLKSKTVLSLISSGLDRDFLFYFSRKFFYSIRSCFLKVGSEDKGSGFNKSFIYDQWGSVGGSKADISVRSGVIFVNPKK